MATRRHGRNAALYMNLTSGGTAEPVATLSEWTLNSNFDTVEVTAFGDTNKTYVVGLPDASGTYSGFWDADTQQMWSASQDGVARSFYLYPDRSNHAGVYWWGTAFFDFSTSTSVSGAVEISGNFSAASAVAKVG